MVFRKGHKNRNKQGIKRKQEEPIQDQDGHKKEKQEIIDAKTLPE
jgi:hypothetical protein